MSSEQKITGVARKVRALDLDMASHPQDRLLMMYQAMVKQLQTEWAQNGYVPQEDIVLEMRVSCVVQEKESHG
jgi:hypothetical protein